MNGGGDKGLGADVVKGVTLRRNVHIDLRVNGELTEVSFAPYKTLLEVLREDLGLPGTKHGCELGECGACAVLVEGEPVLSCLVLAVECEGRAIETIEGMATGTTLHPLQAALTDLGGSQCGYCTPGMLMTAKALLDKEPNPSRERIREAISGNICRCTGYQQIVDAIERAAQELRAADKAPA
jgi:carbon-monoxide dehydrogenase small subunit